MDESFDVFLSYSRDDTARVAQIRDALEALGLKVFFDTEEVDAGEEFTQVIDRAVKGSRCVLGLWSQSALQRRWVRIESRIGLDQSKLVAAVLDGTRPEALPAEFYNVNIEDLSDYHGQAEHRGWANVVRAIGRRVGRADLAERPRPAPRTAPAPTPQHPPPPSPSQPAAKGGVPPLAWAIGGAIAAAIAVIVIVKPFDGAPAPQQAPAAGEAPASEPDNASRSEGLRANLEREAAIRQQVEHEADARRAAEAEAERLAARQQGACEAGEVAACRAYLEGNPNGAFVQAARTKIDELTRPVAANLAGAWSGYYMQEDRRTPFTLELNGAPGEFRGRMVETAGFGDGSSPRLYATVAGRNSVQGRVAFTKTYDGTAGVTHSVSYEGSLDASGRVISGVWTIDNLRGEFRMQRR